MSGHAEFPPQGLVLRGRTGNSAALWIVGLLGIVVLVSDVVVALQWLLVGRPASAMYVFAGVVLAVSTLLLAGTASAASRGVRRQRYSVGLHGLDLAWKTGRLDLRLPWREIEAIARRYDAAPGMSTMGVAVFVTSPERFVGTTRGWPGSPARQARQHLRDHGTPIYLDLTDVGGGTVRFFAAARFYADRAGRDDLVLL